ncbi:uncharacterized protein LOC113794408 [Dermatophagoides pteronyssinus]|uniref:uncharacterized protein LOC113794408 n=1 Tax=Dermatophagoides pteronyssinus TaxID=6956 RepID=UPI003F67FB0D
MKLNKTKISSVSTTSLCSEKESSSTSQSSNIHHHHHQQNHYKHNHFHDSNPATMLLPNTTATAFRSFIKTKSTGIMIRKDHSDDDDEEVEKLCDSECSKLSNECCSTPNTADDTDVRHPEFPNTTTTPTTSTITTIKTNNVNVNDNSDLVNEQLQNRSSSDHSHDSFAIHSIDTNQSFFSSSELYEQQTETGSISSSTFITISGVNNNNQQQQQQQQQSQKSSSKRHHHTRANPILPILKSNRFVKHSKASNILFTNKTQKNHMKKRTNSESGTTSLYSTSSQELVRSLRSDRMIITQPDEDRRRRTIIIEKQKNSFGFTLQTYGIKHGQEIELITYVDEVTYGGPAFRGGMRPGDVILSINGRDVERADHQTLVNYINSCEKTMRLVVLFEDCVRKIELHLEFIKLQKSLQQKLTQLDILNQREDQILLNAALRNCSSNENNNNDNENFAKQLQMKKKYASKSLNVSLNDLDDCRYDIDYENEDDDDDDDDDDDGILVDDRIRQRKDYSTSTFPRHTSHAIGHINNNNNNNNNNNQTNIQIGKNLEENVILIDADDNETSNNNYEDKRNGNNNDRQNDNNDNCKQSISLPQSVHNSLDCLTNEAYEDDENLMLDHNKNNQSTKTSNHKKNPSTISIHSSDSRDFITKL